jgi:ribonuclease PH
LLDLAYVEDKDAEVDFNVVMTGRGQFVEVQGTGEEATFTSEEFVEMLDLAKKGASELIAAQRKILAGAASA